MTPTDETTERKPLRSLRDLSTVDTLLTLNASRREAGTRVLIVTGLASVMFGQPPAGWAPLPEARLYHWGRMPSGNLTLLSGPDPRELLS